MMVICTLYYIWRIFTAFLFAEAEVERAPCKIENCRCSIEWNNQIVSRKEITGTVNQTTSVSSDSEQPIIRSESDTFTTTWSI